MNEWIHQLLNSDLNVSIWIVEGEEEEEIYSIENCEKTLMDLM
jgi:hypothetical protein